MQKANASSQTEDFPFLEHLTPRILKVQYILHSPCGGKRGEREESTPDLKKENLEINSKVGGALTAS